MGWLVVPFDCHQSKYSSKNGKPFPQSIVIRDNHIIAEDEHIVQDNPHYSYNFKNSFPTQQHQKTGGQASMRNLLNPIKKECIDKSTGREVLVHIIGGIDFKAFVLPFVGQCDVYVVVDAGYYEDFAHQDFNITHVLLGWQYYTDCQYYKYFLLKSNPLFPLFICKITEPIHVHAGQAQHPTSHHPPI